MPVQAARWPRKSRCIFLLCYCSPISFTHTLFFISKKNQGGLLQKNTTETFIYAHLISAGQHIVLLYASFCFLSFGVTMVGGWGGGGYSWGVVFMISVKLGEKWDF